MKPGDQLQLVPKVMGFERGARIDKSGPVVTVVSVRRERLDAITQEDCAREGFPEYTPEQFIQMFCRAFKVTPSANITRIEWKYSDPKPA